MSSKTLCGLVRFAVISTAVCALFLALFVIPSWGAALVDEFPELSGWYVPWLIFILLASLPCFALLVFVWKVSSAIKTDEVFTIKTAKWIKTGAVLLFADAAFFFAGNVVFLLLNMSHFAVLLAMVLGIIFVIALALLASVLARYITKAAALQEESEGTI